MTESLSRVAGLAFAAAFKALKVLRPDRPIHPAGVALTGTIEKHPGKRRQRNPLDRFRRHRRGQRPVIPIARHAPGLAGYSRSGPACYYGDGSRGRFAGIHGYVLA